MATTFKYASQSDLKNYFNNFGDFDQKVQIFNWKLSITDWYDDTIDLYYASNTGLITQLYFDGNEVDKITYNATETTKLDGALTPAATSVAVDSGHGINVHDIVKINSEYIRVTSTASTSLSFTAPTTNRGIFGTSPQHHADDSSVYKIIDANVDVGDSTGSGEPYSFIYDTDLDMCILITESDPVDNVIQSGIDFETFADQQLVNSSLELNNLLDARFQMPLPKSTQIKEGAASGLSPEYDPVIIKSTCYITAANLIRAKDVMSEEAQFYMDMVTNTDGTGLVDKLNSGHIKLSFEIDNKDSQGSIRQITNTGSMYLIETGGEFYGGKNGYDLLRITCTTAGAYGVAKCKVEYYGSDKLFGNETTDNIVTGGIDYWSGLGGIGVRLQGSAMAENDQWEIEVYSEGLEETNSVVRNINLYR